MSYFEIIGMVEELGYPGNYSVYNKLQDPSTLINIFFLTIYFKK